MTKRFGVQKQEWKSVSHKTSLEVALAASTALGELMGLEKASPAPREKLLLPNTSRTLLRTASPPIPVATAFSSLGANCHHLNHPLFSSWKPKHG